MEEKYAVVRVVNGAFKVESETSSKESGAVNFSQYCAALWNATEEVHAVVKLMDKNLDVVEGGFVMYIDHPAKN